MRETEKDMSGEKTGPMADAIKAGKAFTYENASTQVSDGSGQLSTTAQGLSQGSCEQAASIEELSSTVR
jgi:methyl-accepting chemotaxis protein